MVSGGLLLEDVPALGQAVSSCERDRESHKNMIINLN
jgi:hypothetical protein